MSLSAEMTARSALGTFIADTDGPMNGYPCVSNLRTNDRISARVARIAVLYDCGCSTIMAASARGCAGCDRESVLAGR